MTIVFSLLIICITIYMIVDRCFEHLDNALDKEDTEKHGGSL